MRKSEREALFQVIQVADAHIADIASGGIVDDRIRDRVCNEMALILDWLRGFTDAKAAPWKQPTK